MSTDAPLLSASHRFCPQCGSNRFSHLQGGQRRCEDCGYQEFNNPIVAVAALILNPANELLLIRRAKDPAQGKLAFPGGFVDAGESLGEAIEREIREETGLQLNNYAYLTSHPNQYHYRGTIRPVCDVFFLARSPTFNVTLQLDEVSAWTTAPLWSLDRDLLAFDSMRHALATARLTYAERKTPDPPHPIRALEECQRARSESPLFPLPSGAK